ncbi:MAG: SET domain-containing protein [Chlamydia sp.]
MNRGSILQIDHRSCQNCVSIIANALDSLDVRLPCAHLGFNAFMLLLLLRRESRFFYIGQVCHRRLWPFPFFESYESLDCFIKWGERAFSIIERQVPHLEDSEMFDLCYNRFSKVSVKWISDRKGFGLVANRDLPKGERIGIYTGLIRPYSKKNRSTGPYVASFSTPFQSIFFFLSPKWVVDANMCGSIMRYMNHEKKDPAAEYELFFWRRLPLMGIITVKEIYKYEEISINYGSEYILK